MRIIFLLVFIFCVNGSWAQETESPQLPEITQAEVIKGMTEMISSSPLSQKDMLGILDQMKSSGQISAKEADDTKKMISQMSASDMTQMKQVIIQMMTKQLQSMKFSSPAKKP